MSPPSLERRAFLRGRPTADRPLRPPWAGDDEDVFLDACNACGACVAACPQGVLAAGGGGHPVFRPTRGECTFCGACVEACGPRALDFGHSDPPWRLKAQVGAGCLTDRGVVCLSCRDACGEAAIRFRPVVGVARPDLDSDRCTGCGACVGVCPASAIVIVAPGGVGP